MKRVCHLSSVHTRKDIRILYKECSSLGASDYEAMYVVADGMGDGVECGVRIIDAGPPATGRLGRMTVTARAVARKARRLRADLYHVHDPELAPYARYLRQDGACVVYDAHEDLKRQLLSKPYLSARTARLLSAIAAAVEGVVLAPFDALVAATPSICRGLPPRARKKTVVVANYPWLDELVAADGGVRREAVVCFVGGITEIRGIKTMVKAMHGSEARLLLAGEFESESLRAEMSRLPGWENTEELGFLGRADVAALMRRATAGIVLFHAVPNHIEAQPNKLFEYMSASLPVIASNFPLWKDIIEGNDCGICVDQGDEAAVRRAIELLLADPAAAERMGKNGRKAIERSYNWESERGKLFGLYERLLS